MTPLRYATIKFDLWHITVVIAHGGTQADFLALAAKRLGHAVEPVENAGGLTLRSDSEMLVWVEQLANAPILVHELFHAVVGILASRGLSLAAESEEAYAYTLSSLLERVLSIKRWRKA